MRVSERLARTFLAPLVPPVRFWWMARTLGLRQLVSSETPRAAFVLVPVLLVIHAMGEVVGYWRIVRDIETRYEHYELHRAECVRQKERSLLIDRP